MISYVVKVLNLCALALQNVLLGASFVGGIIVTVFTGIFSAFYDSIHCLSLFLQILYEDNISLFTEDIPIFFTNFLNVISDQITGVQNGLSLIYYGFGYRIKEMITATNYLISSFFIIILEVIVILKNSVIFIGQTIWFMITFIPVHLPQLLKALIDIMKEFIIQTIVDAYMRLLKITNFLTDVPLESFIGLISAIVIVRLTIDNWEAIVSQAVVCYWSVVRKLLYIYYTVYNYFTDPEVGVITHMASGQEVTARDETYDVDDNGNGADALCVICQDRQKCVLTLPCRHVCLCTECCRRLYGYQRTCPICRTFIYHSVTIYL